MPTDPAPRAPTPAPSAEPRLTARRGVGAPGDAGITGTVTLDYEGRFLRRRRLALDGGGHVLVDLPEAVPLEDGDVLTGDGAAIRIAAAPEPCLIVTGDEIARYAWHVGNRHTPCAVSAARLVIREDAVMADMLHRLGATVAAARLPFTPEGGAYGHGRTMGHAHGPGDGHGPDHAHGPDHGHAGHAHAHG